MSTTRPVITALIAACLMAVAAAAVAAGAETEVSTEPAYFTIEWGENEAFVPPSEETPVEGGVQMRGLARIGIEVIASDPRIGGKMTFFANGAGVTLPDGGHSNLERHSVRIENEAGAWTGTGTSNFFVDGADQLIFDNVVYLLEGEQAYEGLGAYIVSDGVLETTQGVIYGVELPPTPDPVPQ